MKVLNFTDIGNWGEFSLFVDRLNRADVINIESISGGSFRVWYWQ